VVDENERLVGVVSIREIFVHPKETELGKIMRRNLITVSPETGEEKVADIGLKHNIKAVPVVKNRKLLGVVPSDIVDDKFLKVGKDSDGSLPTASASYRGKMIRVEGGAGVADKLYICLKSAVDTYSWVQVASG